MRIIPRRMRPCECVDRRYAWPPNLRRYSLAGGCRGPTQVSAVATSWRSCPVGRSSSFTPWSGTPLYRTASMLAGFVPVLLPCGLGTGRSGLSEVRRRWPVRIRALCARVVWPSGVSAQNFLKRLVDIAAGRGNISKAALVKSAYKEASCALQREIGRMYAFSTLNL